jgi:hypothetical protein
MNWLRKLTEMFTAGPRLSGDVGLYYYVRCDRCGEVIRVRINPMNDLSLSDDGKRLFAHKVVVGRRCYSRIEADFEYDTNHKLTSSQASGGTFVDKETYEADQKAAQEKKTAS